MCVHFMKLRISLLFAAVILLAFSSDVLAQTNVVTVTNYVTVTQIVTNYVIVTNSPVKSAQLAQDGSAKPPAAKVVVPPKFPWNRTVTAGVTLTRGNSDSLLATAKLQADRKTPLNEFNLGVDATYGSANGVENSEIFHGFGQWNHLFSERSYAYLRGEGIHDGIAEIKYRATATSGMGYYFIKDGTNTTLAGELGPGLVLERVGTVDTTYATMRVAERFEHKFNKGSARLWENVEFLPQIDKPSDYLVNSEIGIESALYKTLSLQVFLDDNFNSQPAVTSGGVKLKRNDVKLVSGITYKF
jgi:putative salt-induced outer membrane protein YdiY